MNGTVSGDKLWYSQFSPVTTDIGPGYQGNYQPPASQSGLNPGDTGGLSEWAQIDSGGTSTWRNMGPQAAVSYDPAGSDWYKVPALFVRIS